MQWLAGRDVVVHSEQMASALKAFSYAHCKVAQKSEHFAFIINSPAYACVLYGIIIIRLFEVHVLNSKSDQTRNLCKFDASVYGRECYCSSSSHCHQSSPIHT